MTPVQGISNRVRDIRKGNIPNRIDQNTGYAMSFNGTDEYLTRALPTDIVSNLFVPATATGGNAPTNWSKVGTAGNTTISYSTSEAGSSGCLKVVFNSSSANGIKSTFNLTAGKKYKITIRYKSTANIIMGAYGLNYSYYRGFDATSQWNTVVRTLTAHPDGSVGIWIWTNVSGTTLLIESISIVEDWKLDLNESHELIKHSINRDFEQTLVTTYASNFSAGVDGWIANNTNSITGNIDNIAGENDCLKFTINQTGEAFPYKIYGQSIGKRYIVKYKVFIPSTNVELKKVRVNGNGVFGSGIIISTLDQWVTYIFETTAIAAGFDSIYGLTLADSTTFTVAGINDVFYMKDVQVLEIPNLVTNGTFDSNTIWATNGAGGVVASPWTISGGVASCTSFETSKWLQQSIGVKANKKYRLSYSITAITGTWLFRLGYNGVGLNRTTTGTFSEDIQVPSNPSHDLIQIEGGTGNSITIDNIHIYELPDYTSTGNHSFTYTTADKYEGTGSLLISATGAGSSGSNYVSLPSAQIDTLVAGNKYTLEGFARLDASSLTFGSNLVSGWDLTSGWTTNVCTINSANSATATSINGQLSKASTLATNKIYKLVISGNISSGNVIFRDSNATVTFANVSGTFSGTFYGKSTTYTAFNILIQENGATLTLNAFELYEATPVTLTAQLGTKSVTSSALSIVSGTFTKFVLNFEATASEVGQDLKLWLSGAGSVYVDSVSLTQAYDMVRLSGFRTGVLDSTLESSIFMIGGVGAPTAGGVWSYILNSNRVYRVGMQDNTYNTSTAFATSITFSDNTYYNVCELLDKVGTSYIYVNGVSRASSTNARIVGKVINTNADYPLRIGTWSTGTVVRFKGSISPMQIIRFTNIGQSNFDPTTYKIGQSVSGGNAETVLLLDFGKDKTSMTNILRDWSGTGNNVTGINVDQTNVVRKV